MTMKHSLKMFAVPFFRMRMGVLSLGPCLVSRGEISNECRQGQWCWGWGWGWCWCSTHAAPNIPAQFV